MNAYVAVWFDVWSPASACNGGGYCKYYEAVWFDVASFALVTVGGSAFNVWFAVR